MPQFYKVSLISKVLVNMSLSREGVYSLSVDTIVLLWQYRVWRTLTVSSWKQTWDKWVRVRGVSYVCGSWDCYKCRAVTFNCHGGCTRNAFDSYLLVSGSIPGDMCVVFHTYMYIYVYIYVHITVTSPLNVKAKTSLTRQREPLMLALLKNKICIEKHII